MWRNIILFIGAVLGGAAVSDAQDHRGSLLTASGWVRFQVVYGRLQAIPQQTQVRKTAEAANQRSRVFQTHAVEIQGSHINVDYTLETPAEFMEVSYKADGTLELLHERTDESSFCLTLRQAPHEPATDCRAMAVEIVQQGVVRTFKAANLWSFALSEPRVFDEHVAPALRHICPALRPASLRRRIVQELYSLSQEERPCQARVSDLTQRLGAPRFPIRQAAERQLKLLGPGVLPLLAGIPDRQLDTEQRARILRIQRHYRQPYPDCCERVAAWLASSNDTWLALMHDANPENRQRAFAALCQNCGKAPESFEFLATAPAATRLQQINKLQSQFVKN